MKQNNTVENYEKRERVNINVNEDCMSAERMFIAYSIQQILPSLYCISIKKSII